MNQISKGLKLPGGGGNLSNFYLLLQHERIKGLSKVIYPKYSNANLIFWQPQGIYSCSKILDHGLKHGLKHGLNHGLFHSLFNLFWSGNTF